MSNIECRISNKKQWNSILLATVFVLTSTFRIPYSRYSMPLWLRRRGAVIFLFSLLFIVFACPRARAFLPPRFGGGLTLRLHNKITRLDPTLATRPDEFTVILAIFEPLLRKKDSGTYEPVLLDDGPEKSDDGLTYYFKLKKDVVFHDGSALDASDVLHTIQRVVKSRRSPYAWIFDGIKGTSAYRRGRARDIAGFKIVDAQRFEIQLANKNPNFLRYLCLPAAAIVSTYDHDLNPPIGTGPFKFAGMKGTGEIFLKYFSDYHEGRPYLDSAKFVVVKNDDEAVVEFRMSRLDVLDSPPDGLRAEDKAKFPAARTGPMKSMLFLDVNPVKAPLSNLPGRAALSNSLDRKSFVQIIMNGLGRVENNTPSAHTAGKRISAKAPLALWYPDTGKAVKFLAQKIKHDAAAAGLDIDPRAKQLSELTLAAGGKDVPALILRSLPMLLESSDFLEKTLQNPAYLSSQSTMGLLFGGDAVKKYSSERLLCIYLLSQKTSYIYRGPINDFSIGSFNQIELQFLFLGPAGRNQAGED